MNALLRHHLNGKSELIFCTVLQIGKVLYFAVKGRLRINMGMGRQRVNISFVIAIIKALWMRIFSSSEPIKLIRFGQGLAAAEAPGSVRIACRLQRMF
ncbi:hypothetical protein SDC9_66211 [bioreactor metagenome]|uniref:Uncharacterized protein n=1 Tax=bioreactor metagenome TaxID=1076179 RepID=A0A644XUE9_9ZZZZ